MKRFTYFIIGLLLPCWLFAQTNISRVEYWYDGNYGTASRQTVIGISVNYTDLLDVSSLVPGLHTFTVRFQDNRGVWGPVLTKFFTYSPKSSSGIHLVTDLEYWFNGNYATAVETPLTPGESVDLNALLDVSSLINGLHTVTCRFKDDRGVWSAPFIRFFKKDRTTGLQQLVALEYWFNNDYAGKGSSTFAPTSLLNINEMIDVSALPVGFHFVNLRLQDEQGKWGPAASWYFRKETEGSLPEMHQLTALEYWYDGDYSTVQTDPVSAASILTLDTDLDVSALTDGLHMVSCRFRDEAGEWSPAYSKLFAKYPAEDGADLHEITALEYWYDGDIGTVHQDPVTPTSQLDINTSIDVSALTDGLHMVSTRFRDESGNWSPVFSRLFAKFPADPAPELHQIIAVEYWINGDISSSVKKSVTSNSEYILDTQIDVSGLNDGLHAITYRFQDEAGNWSPGLSHLFSKYADEAITADNKITGYRYWPNSDMESAKEVQLATPVASLAMNEVIDIDGFPGGVQLISIQFRDEQGQWSSAVSETYAKAVNPSVSIFASDVTTCTGSPVIFTADIFDADAIEWSFGDGSTSTELAPVHTYSEGGTYAVSATVTHTDSLKTATATIVGGITVTPSYNVWLGDVNSLFYDSFENETIGAAPSEWTLKYNGTGTSNQIVVENPVKNGSKAFQLEGQSGWAAEFYKRFTGLQDKVTLEAWVNCEKILTGMTGSIGVGNFNVGTWGTRTSRLQFFAGKISATYSGGTTYEIMDYTPGEWYHIRMEHDLVNLTYQVYINNVLVSGDDGSGSTNVFPMHPTVATQDVMLCAGNSGTTKLFFDDVRLYQPGTYEVCANDLPFVLGTQSITTPGFYTETLQTVAGCDSIVNVNLVVKPISETTDEKTICASELPYQFGSQSLTTGGIFTEAFTAVNGCDSIVHLELNVKPVFATTDEKTICPSELPYSFGSQSLTTGGVFTETFTAVNGCDSVVTLTLNLAPVYNPAIDAIADVVIAEDTEVNIPLTGISDGNSCETIQLGFTLSGSNQQLIQSYQVIHTDGESTGTLKITLTPDANGESDLTLVVNNPTDNKQTSLTFNLQVTAVNDAPVLVQSLSNLDKTTRDKFLAKFSSVIGVVFDDVDNGDQLTLSVKQSDGSDLPAWLIFRNDSLISNTDLVETGCLDLILKAVDLAGGEASTSFSLCITFPVGIDDPAGSATIKVYPNPTPGLVYVEVPSGNEVGSIITVVDITGKTVLQQQINYTGKIPVDLSELKNGIYFIRVENEGKQTIHKVVVSH